MPNDPEFTTGLSGWRLQGNSAALTKVFFAEHLDLMKQTFPSSRFIFQTRDWSQIAKSSWWKNYDPEKVKETIEAADLNFIDYHAKNQDCSFIVSFEKLTSGTDHAKELLNFLGEELSDDIISGVLSKKLTH